MSDIVDRAALIDRAWYGLRVSATNRWWRDYAQECAAWTGSPEAGEYRLMEARSESGITVRVELHVTRPMWSATVDLGGDVSMETGLREACDIADDIASHNHAPGDTRIDELRKLVP